MHIYAFAYVCTHVCMYVCMYVIRPKFNYVSLFVFTYFYIFEFRIEFSN